MLKLKINNILVLIHYKNHLNMTKNKIEYFIILINYILQQTSHPPHY